LSPVLSFGHPNGLRTIRERPGHDFDDVAAATHEADGAAAGSAAARGIRATSGLTVSDGTAPALIQWSSRSRFRSSVSGFVRGLLCPRTSPQPLLRSGAAAGI